MFIKDILLDFPIPPHSYLSQIPAIRYLIENKKISLSANVTVFVGENGTGKSTLIEGIAVASGFNPEGGSKNFTFSTARTHSELHRHLTISKVGRYTDGYFLRAESFYNLATSIDKMDAEPSFDSRVIESYGGVSLHEQSHGESFLSLMNNRFFGNGLYILDEPEAALSPMRLLSLMSLMKKLERNNSQFIIATHSPILMSYPGAEILELSENGISRVDYRDTQHYQLTKRMLDQPESVFRYLFD